MLIGIYISVALQADRALDKAYSSSAKAEAAAEAAVTLTGQPPDNTNSNNNKKANARVVRSGAKAALSCLTSKLAQDAEAALKAWQASRSDKYTVGNPYISFD